NYFMGRKLTRPRPKQGAHLARLRKAAGLSQYQLAQLINETQGNIAFWELSDNPPRSQVLPKLANALGVSIPDLIVDCSTKPEPKIMPAKLRFLFEQVADLPRSQQQKIIDLLDIFIRQFRPSRSPVSAKHPKSKSN